MEVGRAASPARDRLVSPGGLARQILIVTALVLCLRLPFLNQAIQGDDVYYLAGAEHAQIDPLHPTHARYVFQGDLVDMRGHSHPPMNCWILALLLAILGDVYEIPFHGAYIVFSLIAAVATLWLARRFSPHPLWAALLFMATPAFVINGASLESDLPFVAFWLAGVALFIAQRWVLAAVALAFAALTAFQAMFVTPILWVYVWLYCRRSSIAWVVALVPILTLIGWQLFELATGGALPAAVLAGYFRTYGFQAPEHKWKNAAALAIHATWLVFPALLPGAVFAAWRRRDRGTLFLAAWIAIFFAGALVAFFAGSMRYLLPIVAPVAIWASWLRVRWLALGFALHMALSLALAVVNYQHWDGYRQFAATLRRQTGTKRVWINGEWGLAYYLETDGAIPLVRNQWVPPGDLVVSSELGYPVPFARGGALIPVAQKEIRSLLPFRLIGLGARSAYSAAIYGLRPFDISGHPIDRLRADLVVHREPSLAYLPMNAPQAEEQLLSGFYSLEANRWRWMDKTGTLLLRSPGAALPLKLVFTIPSRSPVRHVTMLADGHEAAAGTYEAPGAYILQSPPIQPSGTSVSVQIVTDQAFSVPGDRRRLAIVVSEVGFVQR